MQRLDQALDVARTFEPMDEATLNELRARTAGLGKEGRYELFKTSTEFDGTAENPHWLTSAEL